MSERILPILSDPAVAERVSSATRKVIEARAAVTAANTPPRFLSADQYALLEQITAAVLPQSGVGTEVAIAAVIDQRLASGTGLGWRFADLPQDAEAYRQGLDALTAMLQQTPHGIFAAMPPPAREAYLQSMANGDVDGPAQFKLSRWLEMVRVDTVTAWISHPSTMAAIGYYGFADGATGNEGWTAITPNTGLPFEHSVVEERKI